MVFKYSLHRDNTVLKWICEKCNYVRQTFERKCCINWGRSSLPHFLYSQSSNYWRIQKQDTWIKPRSNVLRKKINWKLGSAHKDSKPQVVTCILKDRHTLKLSPLALPSLDKITPATQDYLQPFRWVVEFFCLFCFEIKAEFLHKFFKHFNHVERKEV